MTKLVRITWLIECLQEIVDRDTRDDMSMSDFDRGMVAGYRSCINQLRKIMETDLD
ncbi:MAG: hypothetical protein KGZ75_07910 [Syntrophomonadaceae bacterium]|nr:hypothetical protein [Syntrophomonadaceae bacterium]